jgi:hypothetical protein
LLGLQVKKTNVLFSNRITEDPTANAFAYEYIYNGGGGGGGGVAVGDINNDFGQSNTNTTEGELYL